MLAKPEVVLFDLDNTVYAYAPAHAAGLRSAFVVAQTLHLNFATFDSFQREYDAARTYAKVRLHGQAAEHCRFLYFKRLVELTFGQSKHQQIDSLHRAYWAGYESAMVIDANCRELLISLRLRGIRTAFVTNFTTERQFHKLHLLGLTDIVELIVTSEEVGIEKPDPAIAMRALEVFGVKPSPSVVIVGDSVTDDGGVAKAISIPFIWHRRGGPDKPNQAIAVVDNWAELGAILA